MTIREFLAPPQRRIALAVGIGLLAAIAAYVRLVLTGFEAGDFTWAWRGAQFLLAGENPYQMIRPTGKYPYNDVLYYPLTALLLAVPVAWLPGPVAGSALLGIGSGLLAWGLVQREQYHSLVLFFSPPYLVALLMGQWSPLITAAAFIPSLGLVLSAKPNLGLPMLLVYPSRKQWLLCGALVLLSLIILPSWPWDMLANLATHINYVPLLTWYGPLLLLALPFWRHTEARLLLAMALVPQRLVYDQLALWLIPQTPRQAMLLLISMTMGLLIGIVLKMGELALITAYLPALGIVLWQQRQRWWRWK
ncbi:hypothetical protein [Candidatus Oscillochloris fontis]|uniref:hypothetical protein n=1 Tax=Candidatus Oscillochloris fontis TaxID=2496868 RepID=UPI00101C9150|nr:hypothetical protein [Candidatus Oscillochloris fontis]